MAAAGYPGAVVRGSVIRGVEAAEGDGVFVFQAGTRAEGGQLLAMAAGCWRSRRSGDSVTDAKDRAYAAVARIDWPEGFCRRRHRIPRSRPGSRRAG